MPVARMCNPPFHLRMGQIQQKCHIKIMKWWLPLISLKCRSTNIKIRSHMYAHHTMFMSATQKPACGWHKRSNPHGCMAISMICSSIATANGILFSVIGNRWGATFTRTWGLDCFADNLLNAHLLEIDNRTLNQCLVDLSRLSLTTRRKCSSLALAVWMFSQHFWDWLPNASSTGIN